MRLIVLILLAIVTACGVQAPATPEIDPRRRVDAGPVADGGPQQDAESPRPDSGSSSCDPDRFEPNDTEAAASAVSPGTTDNLSACSGNEDWFLLAIPRRSRARIRLNHDSVGDINLQLLDPEGGFVTSLERLPGAMHSDWMQGRQEVFLLVTNPARRPSAYSLVIEFEEITCEDDRFEPNDSQRRARRISGGPIADLTHCDDDDVFRFSASGGSELTASITGPVGLTLALLGDDEVVAQADGDGATRSLTYTPDADGDYYLRVRGEDFQGAYSLNLERPATGNNDCETAEVIALEFGSELQLEGRTTTANNNYAGSCGEGEAPERVFAVMIPEGGGTLDVWMRGEGDGMDTLLYLRTACDEADSQIACNDDHGGRQDRTDSHLMEELAAGTYYIFADGYGGSAGAFSLELSLEAAATGPACESARTLALPAGGAGDVRLRVENRNGRRQYAPRTCAETSGDEGREAAFTFDLEQPTEFEARIDPVEDQESYDTVLYLLRGCGGRDEIACHDDIDRGNKLSRLTPRTLPAGSYTIVADGFYEGSVGVVDLVLEFARP